VGSFSSELTTHTAATSVDTGTTPGVSFTGGTLTGQGWSPSKTTTSATGVAYTYTFTTASTSLLSSVTLTVPSGTTGATLTVGAVSGIPTGTAVLATGTVTYSFTSTTVSSGTSVSIVISGFTNTSTASLTSGYTSVVTTKDATTTVDTGTTPGVRITTLALVTPAWSASSAVTATASTYTYTFTTDATAHTINTVTMTVPPGTTGTTPAKGLVSPSGVSTGGAVSLTGTTLTYTFTATSVAANAAVSIQITGLTNTSTAGAYTSTIYTLNSGTAVDSGVAAAVGLGSGALTSPTWSVSNSNTGATGVTYTYTFTTGTTSSLTSVTMTVPSGTTGTTLTVGTVSGIPAGTAVLNTGTNTVTYTVTAALSSGTAVSIAISGFRNTATAGSDTSVITTKNGSATVDTGTTPGVTFTSGVLTTLGWATTSHIGGATGVGYTYTFKIGTAHILNTVTMTVPAGTGGTPAVGTVTPAAVALGGSVSLSGSTLTYSFTAGSSIAAGTAVTIPITGLTNTSTSGSTTSTIHTLDAATVIDSGVTPAVSITPVPPVLNITNSCGSSPTCLISGNGTQITLIAIPGASTVSTGSVVLSLQTNASGGYRVQAESSALTRTGGGTLSQAPTAGKAALPINQFYATAVLSGSGSSAAALCAPYGSGTPYVGYNTSALQSLWNATASTGSGTDTVTLTNGIQVTASQDAGVYAGTIGYVVQPAYTGTSGC
jgi:hypothetical protein